ncbi:cell wall elongation regulator TseB-like domain-containing protein [Lactococcus ileimucosae]|uniref:cell wall elongation regulator TseB-like domain-containing protein n=1 Tax=Lactococcus ileimucosae TaxID=2941329 RepID=UPI00204320C3|nr:DUF5590 domain-containing protein [Lactococcus ileimucosae]
MRKKRMSLHSQIIIGILTVILAAFIALSLFIWRATSPYSTARRAAISIAKEKTELRTPTAFDLATTDSTDYSLLGKTEQGKEIGVLIPKNGGNLTVVDLSEGVKADTLKADNTTSIVLALYNDQPVWQVNSHEGFKLYDFKTGKELL